MDYRQTNERRELPRAVTIYADHVKRVICMHVEGMASAVQLSPTDAQSIASGLVAQSDFAQSVAARLLAEAKRIGNALVEREAA